MKFRNSKNIPLSHRAEISGSGGNMGISILEHIRKARHAPLWAEEGAGSTWKGWSWKVKDEMIWIECCWLSTYSIEFGLTEYLEEIAICTTILKSIQWLMIHDMHFRFWARNSSDHMVKCLNVRNIDAVMLNYIPSHTSLRNATYAHLANLASQPTLNHLSSVQNPSIIPLYCLVYKHSPIGNDPQYILYIIYILYIYMASIIPKLIINKVGSGSHCSFESKAYLLQRMTPNVGVSEHPAPKLLKLWTWRIARIAATSQVWPPSSFCQIKIRCSSDR